MSHGQWKRSLKKKPLKKIDIHTHILPPEIPKFKDRFGYDGFIELRHCGECAVDIYKDDGTFFRRVERNCWDPEVRIQECDKSGVAYQVLSTVPVMFSYWAKPKDAHYMSQFLNDHLRGVLETFPKRFFGLGTVPLQEIQLAIEEMQRCQEIGLQGLQIGSHVNGLNFDDEYYLPFFEAAESLGVPLFVHPWDMLGQSRMQKYWLPWLVGMPMEQALAISSLILGGVFDRFPNLRLAFAHGGGAFLGIHGRIEHGFRVRPDLCAQESETSPKAALGKFYVDALVHDERTIEFLVDVYGEDFVAMGSDYPFPLGESVPGSLIEKCSSFSEEVKSKLLYKNALKWLGLKVGDFFDL